MSALPELLQKSRALKEGAKGARSVRVAVLSAIVIWGMSTPPHASAQLGSLIVTITEPAANSTVGGTIAVSAGVTVVGALTVQAVQFTLDGINLGAEDTNAPYSIQWDTRTATNASHTLSAVGRDGLGTRWTSDAVTITVFNDKTPPAVKILSPNAGATLTGTSTVTADASDNVGVVGVQFRVDGAALGAEDTTAPYAVSWDTIAASSGSHSLTAVARDAAGNTAISQAVAVTVDNAPPSVSITAPLGGTTVSGLITLSADASDNVGVAGVRFFAGGVQVGAEDTTAPYSATWDTTTVDDGQYTLTAVARDAVAHTATSSTVTITVSNVPRSAIRFENTDLSVTYTPGTPGPGQPPAWFHGSRSRDWSDGTAAFNRSAGARATFQFTGRQVSWIGFRAFWAGIARVYVDDAFVSEIDLFLPSCTPEQQAQGCIHEDDQAAVFTAAGLAPGAHRLTIEVTGGRNPEAVDNAVVVDAFDVVGAPAPSLQGTRSEETASSFTAGWTQADTTVAWSGGSAARSATAGAQAAFTFTGTEIRWVGLRGPDNGIARIILDGSFHAQVDTYSPTAVQGVVFTATGLAAGRHVLTVEVTGTENAAATNHLVFVDSFDVRSRFEERDHSITYAGPWVQENMDQNWSGTTANTGSGTASFTATAGATATFTFSGTAVSWIGYRGPVGGIANIYLDDAFVAQRDLYLPTEEFRAPVFTAADLAPGTHRLRIEATGVRNGAATGAFVVVDALDVTLPASAPPVSRVEQTASTVVFTTPPDTAGWTHSTPNNLFSGRTVALSTTAGSRSEFTFTGTSVRWIGQRRRDSGIARVFVDGTFVAQVDTFTPIQDELQAAVFTATDLQPGQHVLTIEVTGQMNPASSGSMVIVDAFEVY
jgi:hypothetical protein